MLRTGKIITLLSGLALVVSTASPAIAQGGAAAVAGQKIGVVDKRKVYDQYPRLKSAADQIKSDEERLHRLIETSNKKFEDAKKAKKPQAELTDLHKQLQGQIDKEFKAFQSKAMNVEKSLEQELDNAIQAEAKSRNLDTVFDSSIVLMGGVDITDGVVQRLASSDAVKSTTK